MSLPDPNNPQLPEKPASGDTQAPQQDVVKFAKDQDANAAIMPTLTGTGHYGLYETRPENFLLSFVVHTAIIGLILWLLHAAVSTVIIPPTTNSSVELAPYVPMKIGKNGPSGGGGGDASKLKASAGSPPKAAKQQFTPPTVLVQQQSKLMIAPTVVADLKAPPNAQIGD